MSIILKGIDMPKEGEHILALIKSDGKCSYFEETTFSRIMKTTEAIQIPRDHGNIIDESKAVVTETIDGYYEITAPTILEAEE